MTAAALARAATLALQSLDASLAPLGAGLRMMLQRLRDLHGGEDSYYPPTLAFESLPLTRGRGTMLDSAPRRDAENDNADADDVDFFEADEHNDWGERRTDLGSALEAYARRRIAEFELLGSGIWFATPKRKTSYSVKRQRQMNPLYRNDPIQNFYPCPKCDKGLLKLRHHLCPCDQEKCNAKAVVKVRYGSLK